MSKKLLITGGLGFIGSNFIRYLLKTKEYEITNIDALTYAGNVDHIKEFAVGPNYHFIKVDITNKDQLDQVFESSFDIIVHFAAETHVDRSIQDASSFVHSNVIGTYHLLQKKKRFVKLKKHLYTVVLEV
jgi:dTDP-glucose 4,6-dehydratase